MNKKNVIENIVGVFETGKPGGGDYSTCVYLADGAGITYGKHQATDKSGSLDAIVQRFLVHKKSETMRLSPFLTLLEQNNTVGYEPDDLPPWVHDLMGILERLGSDPIMQKAQDEIFDEWYWEPMAKRCREMGLRHALSWLVMYDTAIHSGPAGIDRMRRLFGPVPPSAGGDEKLFTEAYVHARRRWLSTHQKIILHATVYRMDSILDIMKRGNWELNTPLTLMKPRVVIQ